MITQQGNSIAFSLFIRVSLLVGRQDLFRSECFATRIARVGFDPGVCPHMRFQVTGSFELPTAFSTSTEENRFLDSMPDRKYIRLFPNDKFLTRLFVQTWKYELSFNIFIKF